LRKSAFAASKVRMGFTVKDFFHESMDRALHKQDQHISKVKVAEADDATARLQLERVQMADKLIAGLDVQSRHELRLTALNDPAVRIGRDVSPEVFARILNSVERRLITLK